MHLSLRLSLAAAFGLLATTALPLDVTITILATENCGYANGKLQAVVSGGTPPYTYAWSNGSTQQIPTQLASGNYSVVVTDFMGEQGSANIFLPTGPFLDSDLGTNMVFQGLPYCAGMSPAGPLFNFNQDIWFMFAGVAPFTFDGAPGQSWTCNDVLAGYLVALPDAQDGEVVEVAFLDANGCPGTITVTTGYEVQWPSIDVTNVQAACGGQSNGSIQLAIGEEGNGQTVWMQVINEDDVVVLGQNWTYTIGESPINLTLNQLAPGTYTVAQHIITNECSPLFGQCTVELEVVVLDEADCTCLNGDQFPADAIQITSLGQTQTVVTCVFFGEYSVFSNVVSGGTYEFTVTGNGYITVRQGAVDGPVLGQGFSPVEVISPSGSNFFVHYNSNEQCGTDAVCRTNTVTRILNCEMPVAAFEPWLDCETQLFHVTVDVVSIGDASGVYIVVLGEDPAYSGVGPGSYELGPFATLDMVGVVVVHQEDPDCALAGPFPLLAPPCPDQVVCGSEPLEETFCYANNEFREWRYLAEGEGTLNLRFLRGTIESSNWDKLWIYDGWDANGDLLFEHDINNGAANLGPEGSAVLGTDYAYHGVDVFSSSGALYMLLTSDGSVHCSTAPSYDPWEWEVVCGTVSVTGRAFMDDDLDCVWNGDEPVLPQMIIEVLPGPYYSTTSSTGEYFMLLNEGEYTIRQLNPDVTDHCAPTPQPFEVTADGIQVVIDFPDTAATGLDLAISMTSGPARVGFSYQQAVAVQNLSGRPSGAITLTVEKDPVLGFNNAVPEPTTIVGNTLTWSLPALSAFQQQSVQVFYQVPADITLIGTDMVTTAMVTNTVDEDDLSNNSTTHVRTVTAAYDPNDKLASTSSGHSAGQYILDLDEWIDYTIRFQNTGNDTAFTVVITDTLPSGLDASTIQMGAASHPFSWELKGQGILVFTFANILLPDSNVNEPASHGFVGFRIKPRQPLLPGDEIENVANIYFDFNPPVITEPSVLVATTIGAVAEHAGGTSMHVYPNPTDGSIWVVVNDGGTGSGGEIRVLGMDGRVLLQQRMAGPQAFLDLTRLSAGPYLIELTGNQGDRQVRSLIRQ